MLQIQAAVGDPLHAAQRLLHGVIAEVKGRPVMPGEHEVTNRLRLDPFQHFVNRNAVAKRFGHLLIVDIDESVVHPIARQRLAAERFGLGALALVMGELQIVAASVNIQRVAQIFLGHGRAFDMPARAPRSPWTIPLDLSRLRALPQHEVLRILLALADADPDAKLQLLHVLMRKLAVVRE